MIQSLERVRFLQILREEKYYGELGNAEGFKSMSQIIYRGSEKEKGKA
jgi:hypothetical protein